MVELVVKVLEFEEEVEDHTGRMLHKRFKWPVVPRVGEWIEILDASTYQVEEVTHNFAAPVSQRHIIVEVNMPPERFDELQAHRGWSAEMPYAAR